MVIYVKFLEIYVNWCSFKQFDILVSELYVQIGGIGVEWEKVVVLGVGFDFENFFYKVLVGQVQFFDFDVMMIVLWDKFVKVVLVVLVVIFLLVVEVVMLESSVFVDNFENDVLVLLDLVDIEFVVDEMVLDVIDLFVDVDIMSLDFDFGLFLLEFEVKFEFVLFSLDELCNELFVVVDLNDVLDFDLGSEILEQVVSFELVGVLYVQDDLVVDEVDFDLYFDEE